MSATAGQSRNSPLFIKSSLACFDKLLRMPLSSQLPMSVFRLRNASLRLMYVLHQFGTRPSLAVWSRGSSACGWCTLVETSRLCMRRADSDLNPNHLLVVSSRLVRAGAVSRLCRRPSD
ncbi:hypothetical protein BDV95DRAFT_199663 [Massariosphaeria phaeospora]|uniref:Uncharacterized protein n=1 Tax=Massariosphaeria phaeospora TaxID=100035 RepID=A0A7C8M3V2_9PLEO|nr:hypothetical protein BDV95DRAFT_199663 [Massariosphaeria phaeospora]